MADLYCFGRFALDAAERRLYADGVPVRLGATDLRLLSALIDSAGALVTKEELVAQVWRHGAASDDSLYVHVNALRKVIGDDCIVNKQGRGYRFVAPVQRGRNPPPPRGAADSPAGNLPAVEGLARLIDRGEPLRAVAKLLARGRLVTITGPGGVGKTKFALHAAGKSGSQFPDGAWLVELAGLKDADLAPGAVAAALGVEIGEKAKPLDTLARHLARKSVLFVLDNCEHLIAAAAVLCEAILAAAPSAKILATSREALGCSGEQVFELSPLALPAESETDPRAIRATAAVELFVERAANADARFRMADGAATVAARICRRLDGLPLAIEMAAGWAGALGLETLDAKLDGSIEAWLRAGFTAPARHSTLRDTLAWSFDLLSDAERTVLRRLAVFAASFDLQAAESVAGGQDIPRGQIFEHLARLIRKSMVAAAPGSPAPRYRLLETTRAFALEKLADSVEADATRRRHAHYVLSLLETAATEWESTSDPVWRDRYAPLIDDVRGALDWAMGEPSDDAVALAGASGPMWWPLWSRVEGRQRLGAALSRIHPRGPPRLEARLRLELGALWMNSSSMKAAQKELDRAAALYRGLGDSAGLGAALTRLGYILLMLDEIGKAEQAIAEALSLLEPARRPRMLAMAHIVQMGVETRLGRFAAALAAGNRAVGLCEVAGAERIALVTAANLVELTLDNGDADGAIAAGRGLTERLGDARHIDIRGYVLGVLSGALTWRGDLADALTAAREAAPLLRDDGSLFLLFDHLALRAGLAGRAMDAALLAGHANAIYRKIDHPREPMGRRAVERLGALLADALPAEEIARLGTMGAGLSEDQAMTLALKA